MIPDSYLVASSLNGLWKIMLALGFCVVLYFVYFMSSNSRRRYVTY